MAMDFISLSVGMGYTDETVTGGGALKGKNCVVSNIEEVADGVNVTFQSILDDGTVKTDTAFIPRGTQGETGVAGKSAYQIWLDAGNVGTEEDFLDSLKGDSVVVEKVPQDSCYCTLLDAYTPIIGESVPFSRYSGNMNVENGLVTVKPGQRVQINVGIGYQDSTSTTFGNINFNVRDVTNNIWIGNINVFQGNERYEPRQTVSCQYTNETNSDCQIGIVVRNISEIDILWPNYCWMTVHELAGGIINGSGGKGDTGATPLIHVNGMGGGEKTMAELAPNEGIIAICTNVSGGSFFTSVTDGTVKCNGTALTSGKTPTAGTSYVIVNSGTSTARIYCKNNGGSAWAIMGDVL